MQNLRGRIESITPVVRMGEVVQVTGLVIESIGPNVSLGDVCEIRSDRLSCLQAEVVGFRDHRVLLMPLGEMQEIHAGCQVAATGRTVGINVSDGLIGRIIDGLGRPIDAKGPLPGGTLRPLHCQPPNPLTRQRILQPFQTGVKSLDLFTPVGRGQRLGIFAGSGVGKSTLLNALLGQRLAATSQVPQTTRTRVLGVVDRGEVQLAFLDTPGIHLPKHALNERMMAHVDQALEEADLILWV
ncbi:MAG: GTPase, partial [Deltaproteobacteria bacterium]